MTRIAFILGTRPEIIKLFSCIKYCEDNNIDHFVVNTDQHYDKNMRDVFFQQLGIQAPRYQLGVGSGSHAKMLASMLGPIEDVLVKEKPDVVVVQGDTNTVLAGALVAVKLGIKVAHVEAGLRSYDKSMPEEYNRIITDRCSDYLFAPTEKQQDILLSEGTDPHTIWVTGNTVVDAVLYMASQITEKPSQKYALLTAHRPSNTDTEEHMVAILEAVQEVCEREDIRCVFPVHPRLNNKLDLIQSFNRIDVVQPLGFRELVAKEKNAEIIFTDSGGIQEEACVLRKKCVILRTNTERPETVEVGGAVLVEDITKQEIVDKYYQLKDKKVDWYNPFGDGTSAAQIMKILTQSRDEQ